MGSVNSRSNAGIVTVLPDVSASDVQVVTHRSVEPWVPPTCVAVPDESTVASADPDNDEIRPLGTGFHAWSG